MAFGSIRLLNEQLTPSNGEKFGYVIGFACVCAALAFIGLKQNGTLCRHCASFSSKTIQTVDIPSYSLCDKCYEKYLEKKQSEEM